ncbi:unnamed protein product, partial [Brassica rapa subsp. trilocularis]
LPFFSLSSSSLYLLLYITNYSLNQYHIMGDHSSSQASYIHLVHHLIEECIVFNMGKKECMDALFKHANINPIITSTGTYTRIYIYTHKCTHTRH